MALRYYANAPATTLANACSAVTTSLTLTSTAGLPISYPYMLIVDRGTATEEAVEVTGGAGTTLTVIRGADSTTAFSHAAGATVSHGLTARDIREANTHVNSDAGVHGVSGDVVGTTDTQTLSNKTLASPVMTGTPTAPTASTSDNDTTLATTAFVKAVLLASHPVGSIYIHTVNTNPSSFIGGTWVAWGAGRVPVGVDTGQTEFNTAEEIGGAKTHTLTVNEMPSHNHGGVTGANDSESHGYGNVPESFYGQGYGLQAGPSGYFGRPMVWDETSGQTHTHAVSSQGGGAAHNNLQPYITCYMFKRTA